MPEGMGYGMVKVKVPNIASGRAIPPKGLPTASNGAAYREKKARIPENAAKADRGAATSGAKKLAPKPDRSTTKKGASLGGQQMRGQGRGYSKLRGR